MTFLLLAGPGQAGAQGVVDYDTPVQVNTVVTDDQGHPAIARNAAGEFLVVWESEGSDGGDTDGTSVRGRVYDASFTPLGPDFQINTTTADDQGRPAVIADGAGDFVVLWQSGDPAAIPGTREIRGQRIASDGSALGPEFLVHTVSDDATNFPTVLRDPALARSPGGDVMAVWEFQTTENAGADFTDHHRIEAVSLGAGAGPDGPIQEVAVASCGAAAAICTRVTSPDLAGDGVGGFVVIWDDFRLDGVEIHRAMARRVGTDAAPLATAFRVSTENDAPLATPRVVRDGDDLLAVWRSQKVDESRPRIRGRRLALGGDPLGTTFPISPPSNTVFPTEPSVSTGDSPFAEFEVAWSDSGLKGRKIDSATTPFGVTVDLGVRASIGASPALAPGIVVWQSNASYGDDASGFSIQARRTTLLTELGLLASWGGDGDASDDGPLGNDGTLVGGAGFSEGILGRAFDLDGLDDEVVLAHDGDLALDQGFFSVAFWIATTDDNGGILSKQATASTAGFSISTTGGELETTLRRGDGGSITATGPGVNDGGFHHVVVTVERRGERTRIRTFVDGAGTSLEILALFDTTNIDDLRLGFAPQRGYLEGRIDGFRIYDRLLSPSEIEVLYETAGAPIFRDGFESGDTLLWTGTDP